ncbi:hypothetical protein CRI77_18140 [Mycolicibacterium duvalii]|uniref:Uncharacterized protein n=1 Tax=Mycolicibacterium duvalii TaxID=39688 RepID=A0A7I7K006_9MYCO|nr:DUF1990 domain-containing protein [Mycolicibacterium duvalii]MCV7368700.1 DUF1990 domain-containing protein [Mycolicibacterium duvalii]PEG38695.1 hypothetical protein CRI77_18140 [Mycolicibacterium duvalii]BBX16924.1 hypothetical protein MDUV_17840 [Mycolicibacterium duvalii]
MKLSDLTGQPLTYQEVGATADAMPPGYRHLREAELIGKGRERFERAAAAGMRWGMLRGAGLRVEATSAVAEVGAEVLVHLGPVAAPCRVVYVIDEADRRGFAYGTLGGHPESGEEMFAVRFDPATGDVYAEVSAFSRHATWWSRLAAPATSLMQRLVTRRYLRAL